MAEEITEAETGAGSLLGRSKELGLLAGVRKDLSDGLGRLVVLRGEAGMGKTSLAQRMAAELSTSGVEVVWARCWEAVDAPPYWLWTQIARSLGSEEVIEVLGGSRAPAGEDRLELFEMVEGMLRARAAQGPLGLILEDIHAADEPSLMLLGYVAHHGLESPLLVLATYDPSEARRRSDHETALTSLSRDGKIIDILPLEVEQIAELHASITGERASDAVADALTRVSEGNPFLAREAIRLLTMKGELQRPDGSAGFRVPEGARDLILRHVSALPEQAVEVLAVASVLGRSFDVGVLSAVIQAPAETLLEMLEPAVTSSVVEEEGAWGRYRFRHILLRELLYEELTAARRMRLHRGVAEALGSLFGDDPERLSELAHHWFKSAQAGDPERTLELVERAGRQALERQAYEEAARLFQRALKVGESFPIDKERRRSLKDLLSEAEARSSSTRVVGSTSTVKDRMIREGEYWTLSFAGRVSRLKDGKGPRYLAVLLSNPETEIHSLDLAQRASREVPSVPSPDGDDAAADPFAGTGPVLDEAAKRAYQARLQDLSDELEEATSFNDDGRVQLLKTEIDALVTQLSSAIGLGGRDRVAGSPAERARVNVTKSLRDTLRRIELNDPELARHLNATVRTGTYCSYVPDPSSGRSWEITEP